MSHCSVSSQSVCVFVSKSGGVCFCASGGHRVGKVLCESYLGSVMFITHTYTHTQLSGLDTTEEQK